MEKKREAEAKEGIESVVKLAENIAEKISSVLNDFLKSTSRLVILYCGDDAVASYVQILLKLSEPHLDIIVLNGDLAHNVVLPYLAENIDKALIVAYRDSSCLARAMRSCAMLGIDFVAITTPVDENTRRFSYGKQLIEIDEKVYRLAMMFVAIRIASQSPLSRLERLRKEVVAHAVIKDLLERYHDIPSLNTIDIILCSNVMEIVCKEMRSLGMESYVLREVGIEDLESSQNVLLVYSSVEDPIVNEFVMKLSRMKPVIMSKLRRLRVDTDPFTAPIYAMIVLKSRVGSELSL